MRPCHSCVCCLVGMLEQLELTEKLSLCAASPCVAFSSLQPGHLRGIKPVMSGLNSSMCSKSKSSKRLEQKLQVFSWCDLRSPRMSLRAHPIS